MPTLRLVAAGSRAACHTGEVFGCAYTPDGRNALSAGWDGRLMLWDADTGEPAQTLPAGPKPLSACAVSPDATLWVSGSMDGVLCGWDTSTHLPQWHQMGHTRPISAIVFSTDGSTLATASWDRSLALWNLAKGRDRKALTGHTDIVAGCRFTVDGTRLFSWSHDGTLRLWDVESGLLLTTIKAHRDRVTAAALSPDGRWAVSAARDDSLKLWDLHTGKEARAVPIGNDLVACVFLLDGESLVTVSADGRVSLRTVPALASGLAQRFNVGVQCAALSPSGSQLAIGGTDGRVHRVEVDGFDQAPLLVSATRLVRRTANTLQRIFGGSTVRQTYQLTCPVCRESFELRKAEPGQGAGCPACRRKLRLGVVTHPVNA